MLTRLSISDFRIITKADLGPAAGFNVLAGPNGSGKTSVLEAIYFAAVGRSFRQSRIKPLIRQDAERIQLVIRCRPDEAAEVTVGLEHDGQARRLRFRGAEQQSRVEVARALPVQAITPDSHALVQGSPEMRRRFVDWGTFHVEHGFHEAWQRYRYALQQRNRALKANASDHALAPWSNALIDYGHRLDGYRRAYVAALAPRVREVALALSPELDVALRYRAGWPEGVSLAEALADTEHRDQAEGRTTVGPHRADLWIGVGGTTAAELVSRGQEKLLAVALAIAQMESLRAATGRKSVLLFDDPGSELDDHRRTWLWGRLAALETQVWLTTTEKAGLGLNQVISPQDVQWFHVEQGRIKVASPPRELTVASATG